MGQAFDSSVDRCIPFAITLRLGGSSSRFLEGSSYIRLSSITPHGEPAGKQPRLPLPSNCVMFNYSRPQFLPRPTKRYSTRNICISTRFAFTSIVISFRTWEIIEINVYFIKISMEFREIYEFLSLSTKVEKTCSSMLRCQSYSHAYIHILRCCQN